VGRRWSKFRSEDCVQQRRNEKRVCQRRVVSGRGEIVGKEGWRAMLCFGHLDRKVPRAA
jgi:hypothetical protein